MSMEEGQRRKGRKVLTSLLIQLLQHLSNDLPNTLQGLEVIFGLVVLLVQVTDPESRCSVARERTNGIKIILKKNNKKRKKKKILPSRTLVS